MLFKSVNKKGKNPLEKRSISIARRNLFWAGVNIGTASLLVPTELVRGVVGVIEPPDIRTVGLWTITFWRNHGEFESMLSFRSRWQLCARRWWDISKSFDCGGIILFLFFSGLGMAQSPSTIFTKQYSIRAMNTKIVHTDINASTAFKYDTGGNDACDFACCVDKVKSDVTPRVTRAGAASGFIQNETH